MQRQRPRGASTETTNNVQLQPAKILAAISLFFMGFGTLPLLFHSKEDSPLLLMSIFLLFEAFAVWGLLWTFRARIHADENGLRWRRTFGGWQSARWEDITDYYHHASAHSYVVRLADGRKLVFDSMWPHYRRLMVVIAARATQAKARGWLRRTTAGTVTGTQTFRYTPKSFRKARTEVWTGVVMVVSFAVLCGVVIADPWHKMLSVLLIILVPLLLLCLYLLKTVWGVLKDLGQRKNEWLVADENGITLHRGDTVLTTPWSGIQRASYAHSILYLETENGDITFNKTLENIEILAGMVRQYAPQLIISRPRHTARELLAPTERTDGKRTFHSRTRSNRASLATPLAVAAVLFGVALWAADIDRRYPVPGARPMPVVPLMVMGLVGCVGWLAWLLWYRQFRIVVDKESITRHTLFGTTQVFYEEIAEIGYDTQAFGNGYIATRDGKHPITWPRSLASEPELMDELTQRTGLTVTIPSITDVS